MHGNTRKADEENPTRNMFYMTADKFMIKYPWTDKKFCMHEQMTYASPDDVSHVPAGHATYSHAQFYSYHGDSARTYMTSTNLTINSFNFYAKFAYLHVNWLKMFRSSSHFLQSPFGAFGETGGKTLSEEHAASSSRDGINAANRSIKWNKQRAQKNIYQQEPHSHTIPASHSGLPQKTRIQVEIVQKRKPSLSEPNDRQRAKEIRL